jgi:hypothetical protein
VQAPTRGRMLDRIGFEVENLDAFCKELEAKGKSSIGRMTPWLRDSVSHS